MSILGFSFVGVRTERFAEVRALYRDVLRMSMIKDEPQAAWFVTPTGDQMHVYGPDESLDAFTRAALVHQLALTRTIAERFPTLGDARAAGSRGGLGRAAGHVHRVRPRSVLLTSP